MYQWLWEWIYKLCNTSHIKIDKNIYKKYASMIKYISGIKNVIDVFTHIWPKFATEVA